MADKFEFQTEVNDLLNLMKDATFISYFAIKSEWRKFAKHGIKDCLHSDY